MPGPVLVVPPNPWRQILARMAALGKTQIIRRAFPATGPGKDPKGQVFSALSPNYAKWKRKKGREPVPNQRLTSKTATAYGQLGGIRATDRGGEVTMGWRTRREVAEALQKRNKFLGHSAAEEKAIVALAQKELQTQSAKVRVKPSKLVIDISLGGRRRA